MKSRSNGSPPPPAAEVTYNREQSFDPQHLPTQQLQAYTANATNTVLSHSKKAAVTTVRGRSHTIEVMKTRSVQLSLNVLFQMSIMHYCMRF